MCFARGAVMTSAPRAFAQTLRPTFLACAVAALVACTVPNAPQEQCLICHGPGRIAAIGEVHAH